MKELRQEGKIGNIPDYSPTMKPEFPFFLEALHPFLFWQTGTSAAIFSLLEILLKSPIALSHLLLAKLVTILFLLQHKQQIFLPMALQTLRNLILACLHPMITKRSKLMWIAFACQDGFDDSLPRHSAYIAQNKDFTG